MEPVLIHTLDSEDKDWHVYFGLKISVISHLLGGNVANIIYFKGGQDNLIGHIFGLEHYFNKVSAHYYVEFRERQVLLDNIERDIAQRKLWTNRIQEYNDIVNKFS